MYKTHFLSLTGIYLCLIQWLSGQTFEELGELYSADYYDIRPTAISNDGSVIVGVHRVANERDFFVWENGEMSALPRPPADNGGQSVDLKVSGDGSIMVTSPGWIWEDSVFSSAPENQIISLVSGDGKVFAGRLWDGQNTRAFRIINGELELLDGIPGNVRTVKGISRDGSVITGEFNDPDFVLRGFVWKDGVSKTLEPVAGRNGVTVRGISDNGNVVVGESSGGGTFSEPFQPVPAKWVDGAGESLGESPIKQYSAHAVSDDGSIVVGIYSRRDNDSSTAFIWTEEDGILDMDEFLTSKYNLNLQGISLVQGAAITPDGTVITGVGFKSGKGIIGWRAELVVDELQIKIDPDQPNYGVDEALEVQVIVKHSGNDPITYAFEDGLFTQDPEPSDDKTPVVTFGEFETPEPFTLSKDDPERTFTILATTEKPGVLTLNSSVSAQPAGGPPYLLEAGEKIVVNPISTEITIANKRHHWNSTQEADWGERAQAINAQRRTDGEEPYLNLIEIEALVTNESDEPIENLNIQDVRDITGYIQSTTKDPAVPLLPIRLFAPDGAEVDLTNPEDPTEVNDVTLQPEETATFAWVVEAFEIDVDVREDPFDLEFTPLILGSQSGINLQTSARETFSVRLRGPIVVNVTSDDRDFDPEDGVIDVDPDEEGEQISLRAAIEYANDTPGLDRIEFDIPGNGVPTIEIGLPPEGTNVMATGVDGDLFQEPIVTESYWMDRVASLNPIPYLVELENIRSKFNIISALKTTDPIEIDGTTQAAGWVELSGANPESSGESYFTYSSLNGLEIAGGDSTVSGLVINQFSGIGLVLTERGDNHIFNNRLGTDVNGQTGLGNGDDFKLSRPEKIFEKIPEYLSPLQAFLTRSYIGGLLVNSPNNLIGGLSPEETNLIAGNGSIGDNSNYLSSTPFISDLIISGSKAENNRIIGNIIGTNISGDQLAQGIFPEGVLIMAGVLINNGATGTELRDNRTPSIFLETAQHTRLINNELGPRPGISTPSHRGSVTVLMSSDTTIKDNTFFVSEDPNSLDEKMDPHVNASLVTITGAIHLDGANLVDISNNTFKGGIGLEINGSDQVTVTDNRFEAASDPELEIEGRLWRIDTFGSTNVKIGGSLAGDTNLFTMTNPLGDSKSKHGILRMWGNYSTNSPLEEHDVQFIGNTILPHPEVPPSLNAVITDIDNDGPDEIEFGDLDGKQNYPRVTSATLVGNQIRFEGNLDSSLGGANYHLDFYSVRQQLPSGHGGSSMEYVGRGIVTTDIDGYGQFFDILLPAPASLASHYTATATRVDGGETSEFSRNVFLERGSSSDNDGVSDERESGLGDRNGDGINDSEQDNVASFSAPNGADTTIQVSAATSQSGDSILPRTQGDFATLDDVNPTLENVLPETQASMGAPKNYAYSNGVITFEVPDLSAGASVSVRIILADDATADTLWVLLADDTWTNSVPFYIEGNQVTLTLTDGGPGDRDGEANGRIVAAIGPATALPPIPDMNFIITRQADSHTLSWPLPYSNALLEFSPDLSPDSWGVINFADPEFFNGKWQLTLPNPLPEINNTGFYRLRYQE